MKLNEKGKAKLRNFCNTLFWAIETGDPVEDFNFAVESFDFEADDFKDCIVLSVEEADEVYDWMLRSFRPPREFTDNFLAKLKQAEAMDES